MQEQLSLLPDQRAYQDCQGVQTTGLEGVFGVLKAGHKLAQSATVARVITCVVLLCVHMSMQQSLCLSCASELEKCRQILLCVSAHESVAEQQLNLPPFWAQ